MTIMCTIPRTIKAVSMNALKSSRQSLTKKIKSLLMQKINNNDWVPGDKLPTEHELANQYSVSRTVIREAVSGLKADGLLASRQGSGIFVIEPQQSSIGLTSLSSDPSVLSSVIETLELRDAVETGAAGLAAKRCSPSQEANIFEKFNAFKQKVLNGENSEKEDFAFHVSIAEASNNAKFIEFLTIVGRSIIPRSTLRTKANLKHDPQFEERILHEHQTIMDAISRSDIEAARTAMHEHLTKSAENYRLLVRLSKQL